MNIYIYIYIYIYIHVCKINILSIVYVILLIYLINNVIIYRSGKYCFYFLVII